MRALLSSCPLALRPILRRRVSMLHLLLQLLQQCNFLQLARAVIEPGDTNARWYADFSMQLNLTEVVDDLIGAIEDPVANDVVPGEVASVLKAEVFPYHGNLLQIHGAVFQEDVRQYWENQTPGGTDAVPMALFLTSMPYALQQQLLTECPMVMAAAFLLTAEILAYTEVDQSVGLHKYEVARHLGAQNPDHTDAWNFGKGLRRVEAALQRERIKSVVDVVVVHCREDLLAWLPMYFVALPQMWSAGATSYMTKIRVFVYHKCGSLEQETEATLLQQLGGLKRLVEDTSGVAFYNGASKDEKTKVPKPRTFVAQKTAGLPIPIEVSFTNLRNYAMESIGYATHLAWFDDHKSDVLFFLQGEPIHHQVPDLLSVALQMVNAGTFPNSVPFLHLNQRRFLGSSHECVYELLEKMGFPEKKTFAGYCCSQFVVPRKSVLLPASRRTDADVDARGQIKTGDVADHESVGLGSSAENAFAYQQARKLLDQEIPIKCSQDTSHDARPGIHTSALYEHMWQVLFQQPSVLPMRKNDYALPVFLRTEGLDPVFRNFALSSVAQRTAVASMFER
ncbi:unnamed protein product [Amoebophrya sp. A120]|nr:unnamed protein product [Amoebophrya sp. A120]|eukprot:GSA120T00012866001.1